jgi:hypothetical protein
MEEKLILGVYRRLDNRALGFDDDSEMALELHNKRKLALEEVFEHTASFEVEDWGQTKDERPHEFVEIIVGIVSTAAFNYVIVPGIKFVAEKLAEKLIDETVTESVKWIISKLKGKQKSKEILDFQIKLPDGTEISVDPPDRNASITIQFSDGKVESIQFH